MTQKYSIRLLDDLASELCARQTQFGCNSLQTVVRTLIYSHIHMPNWKKEERDSLILEIERAVERFDKFEKTFNSARFGAPHANECVDTLKKIIEQLASAGRLITVRKSDQKEALKLLESSSQSLEDLHQEAERELIRTEKLGIGAIRETARADAFAITTDPAGVDDFEPNSTVFRVLHLSDLHFGQPHEWAGWPHVFGKFKEDLDAMERKLGGPWDAVLFSGDMSFSATSTQFDEFDSMLAELWRIWEGKGWDPIPSFLAVPGNHDVDWQKVDKGKSAVKQLFQWHRDTTVLPDLWSKKQNSEYFKPITDAFGNYMTWWKRQEMAGRRPAVHPGFIPGDFSTTIKKNGYTLGIIGLNSAFLQLKKGKFKGKLAIENEQFHHACDENGPKWAENHNLCILMTHHPSSWLFGPSKDIFHREICDPKRFALHLCGHMHEPLSKRTSEQARPEYRSHQAAALYGRKTVPGKSRSKRIHGYAAFEIEVCEKTAKLKTYSRIAMESLGWEFVDDPGFCVPKSQSFRGPKLVDISESYRSTTS